jgi:hypothetical protein
MIGGAQTMRLLHVAFATLGLSMGARVVGAELHLLPIQYYYRDSDDSIAAKGTFLGDDPKNPRIENRNDITCLLSAKQCEAIYVLRLDDQMSLGADTYEIRELTPTHLVAANDLPMCVTNYLVIDRLERKVRSVSVGKKNAGDFCKGFATKNSGATLSPVK